METLRDLARAACDKKSDINAAVAWAEQKLDADRELFDKLIRPMIRAAIRDTIHDLRHDRITAIKRHAEKPESGRPMYDLAAVEAGGQVVMRSLLKMPMPNGGVLADYTAPMLKKSAEVFARQGLGMLRRAQFCRALIGIVGDRTVGETVTETKAKKIWTSTRTDGAGQLGFDTLESHARSTRKRKTPQKAA